MRSVTATEMMRQQSHARVMHAMDQLLHKLKKFVRAYPRLSEDLPDHDISFVTGVGEGNAPDAVIADAMKSTPALWLHAVPDNVVIVPRDVLKKFGITSGMIEVMEGAAHNYIESEGARLLHEEDEKRRAEMWK